MNSNRPAYDNPQGWAQYSRMLRNTPPAPLPEGYEQRLLNRIRLADGGHTLRRITSLEWIGGASLSVFAAIVVFWFNSLMPTPPVPPAPTSAETAVKAQAKHSRTVRHSTQRRIIVPQPDYTMPTFGDTMPPETLEQEYENPAVTGSGAFQNPPVQHDAQPGVPAMTR